MYKRLNMIGLTKRDIEDFLWITNLRKNLVKISSEMKTY
jgi:hypothetical protein